MLEPPEKEVQQHLQSPLSCGNIQISRRGAREVALCAQLRQNAGPNHIQLPAIVSHPIDIHGAESRGCPVKALVLWADRQSTNLGVQALAEGTSSLLSAALPGVDIRLQSYGAGDSPLVFDSRLLFGLNNPASKAAREVESWLESFDVVVDTGAGDSFADIYGMRRLIEMSSVRAAVARTGVPLMMGAQTIGPFKKNVGRKLGQYSIRGANLVVARETASQTYARTHLGVDALLGTDVAFAIAQEEVPKSRQVLVNVSGLLWANSDHVDNMLYQERVVSLLRGLADAGHEVALLSHVIDSELADNDRFATEAAAAASGTVVEILTPRDLSDVRQMIASSRLVIGSRMHACLNALSQGVPTIPWAYSRKFAPLMADLNWGPVFDLRDNDDPVPGTLIAAASLMNDGGATLAQGVRDIATEKNLLVSRAIGMLL